MTTPGMEESNQPLIQLFRAVQEALSIAGSDVLTKEGLKFDRAELEVSLGTRKEGVVGIEIKSLGIDASGARTSESTHAYRLKLKPARTPPSLSPSALEVAESVLALAKAASSVAERGGGFTIDEAVVVVDVTRSQQGGFKVGVGGHGGSETVGRITLTFKKRVD